MRGGRAVIVLEHVTRLHDDLAPDWPQPAGQGCYRVTITGEPNYTLDLQLLGHRRRPQHRRAQGHRHAAGQRHPGRRRRRRPGLLTALDLPPIFGRGLVR